MPTHIELFAADALTDRWVRVSAEAKPLQHAKPAGNVYGVYDEKQHRFLGLVDDHLISRYPQRIFADIAQMVETPLVAADTPLEQLNQYFQTGETAVAVVDDNDQVLGAVTQASLLHGLVLWHEEAASQLKIDQQHQARWSQRLGALSHASQRLFNLLGHSRDTYTLCQNGIEILTTLIEARYGAVAILGPHLKLQEFIQTGMNPEAVQRLGAPPQGIGLLGDILHGETCLNIPDIESDPRFSGFPEHHPRMGNLLAAPVSHNGQVLGRVYLSDKHDGKPFSSDDELIVQSFANTLGLIMIQAEEQQKRLHLEQDYSIASLAFKHSQEGMLITDAEQRIIMVNDAFTTITGYQNDEVIGQNPSLLSSGKQDQAFYQRMYRELFERDKWEGEIQNRRKNGEIYSEWLKINLVRDANQEASYFVATFFDLTEQKRLIEQVSLATNYDSLTQLPNRRHARNKIRDAIHLAKNRKSSAALMFMDIDHFKSINDSYGHQYGDLVLQQVSHRLNNCIRSQHTSVSTDHLSRQGGDEFTLVLHNIGNYEAAEAVAQRVMEAFAHPIVIDHTRIHVTLSIGIALYPDDADTVDDLLINSDSAMYEAKRSGRNCYRIFNKQLAKISKRESQIRNDLFSALKENQFYLHYQPRVGILDGRIRGFEALLRWQHPQLGPISPKEFIPILENSAEIDPVGQWVMETAMHQCRLWRDGGFPELCISINVSASQFLNPGLADTISKALERHRLPADAIEIEITETIAIKEPETTREILKELNDQGIRCALDDFGTGYSSLGHLSNFPFSVLKINQVFINQLDNSEKDRKLVKSILSIGRALDIDVVAEGVETESQLQYLRYNGCHEFQGYLYSKPIDSENATRLLAETK